MHAIGTAARRSGVGVETIRYYERTGVVPRPGRSASGRRLYSDGEVARLRFVRRCRDLGFPLDHVRTLLALGDGPAGGCADARALAERHLQDVRAKIDALRGLEAALVEAIAGCDEGRTDCPLLAKLLAD